jgi:hypothetical protein
MLPLTQNLIHSSFISFYLFFHHYHHFFLSFSINKIIIIIKNKMIKNWIMTQRKEKNCTQGGLCKEKKRISGREGHCSKHK